MKAFLIKYQAIVGFLLGIAMTLAAQTTTKTDDTVVKGLQDSFNQFLQENMTTVTPTTVN